jgi:effector-binding domain-containing protein
MVMVIVKRLALFILVILAVWLAVPLMLPETMAIRGRIEIDAPANLVYAQLNDFRNWPAWSSWYLRKDMPEPQYARGGYGPGGRVTWEANGNEEYLQQFTVVNSTPHHFTEIAMDFRQKAFCLSRISLSGSDAHTAVSWDLGIKTEGWKTLLFILNNKKTLEKSLSSLRKSAELRYRQGLPIVEQGTIDAFPFVSVRRQVSWNELSDKMAEFYDLIISNGGENTYQIKGYPYAIYHTLGEEYVDIECGFPVEKNSDHQGIIFSGIFSETICIITEHTGSYETLDKGHEAVKQWIDERGLIPGGPPVEIYVTDEENIDHPDLWKTRICYPIKLPWE